MAATVAAMIPKAGRLEIWHHVPLSLVWRGNWRSSKVGAEMEDCVIERQHCNRDSKVHETDCF